MSVNKLTFLTLEIIILLMAVFAIQGELTTNIVAADQIQVDLRTNHFSDESQFIIDLDSGTFTNVTQLTLDINITTYEWQGDDSNSWLVDTQNVYTQLVNSGMSYSWEIIVVPTKESVFLSNVTVEVDPVNNISIVFDHHYKVWSNLDPTLELIPTSLDADPTPNAFYVSYSGVPSQFPVEGQVELQTIQTPSPFYVFQYNATQLDSTNPFVYKTIEFQGNYSGKTILKVVVNTTSFLDPTGILNTDFATIIIVKSINIGNLYLEKADKTLYAELDTILSKSATNNTNCIDTLQLDGFISYHFQDSTNVDLVMRTYNGSILIDLINLGSYGFIGTDKLAISLLVNLDQQRTYESFEIVITNKVTSEELIVVDNTVVDSCTVEVPDSLSTTSTDIATTSPDLSTKDKLTTSSLTPEETSEPSSVILSFLIILSSLVTVIVINRRKILN